MKTTMAFSKVLKEIRLEKKLSQERLADLANLDRTYISLLERNKRNPSIEIVFSLSKGLGIRPSVFIQRVEKKTNENN